MEFSLGTLFHLSERHFMLFPLSWFVFFILGRALMRTQEGRMGRGVDIAVRNVFLLTFVSACSLIQLVTLELSGSETELESESSFSILGTLEYLISCLYLHPHLRQLAWKVTLYLLCILLNVVIPLMTAATFFRHRFQKSPWKTAVLSVLFLGMYQCYLWAVGEVLPVNASRVGFTEPPPTSLFSFIFRRSLQQSVAHLAAVGTAFSAIINGFASVSFPLEQLMIMKGVDGTVLEERDKTLRSIVRGIIDKKKKLALEVYSLMREDNRRTQSSSVKMCNIEAGKSESSVDGGGRWSRPSFRNMTDRTRRSTPGHGSYAYDQVEESVGIDEGIDEEKDCDHPSSKGLKKHWYWWTLMNVENYFIRYLISALKAVLKGEYTNARTGGKFLYRSEEGRKEIQGGGVRLSRLPTWTRSLHKEIVFMEKMCQDCYVENAYFKNLFEQSERKKTTTGRVLYSLGHFLSVFAFLRFFGGLSAVYGYFTRFLFSASGDSSTADLNEISQETYDGIVMRILNLLSDHLGLTVDIAFWSPLLSFLLVSSLALMQIRGFLNSTHQMSQLGGNLPAMPSETHALLWAYVAGSYFMACVVLLRVHLPRRFRIGVTAVLGEERDFGFYVWWYEVVFVVGTIVAAVYIWLEKSRQRRGLEPILSKAKYEQRHRRNHENNDSMASVHRSSGSPLTPSI